MSEFPALLSSRTTERCDSAKELGLFCCAISDANVRQPSLSARFTASLLCAACESTRHGMYLSVGPSYTAMSAANPRASFGLTVDGVCYLHRSFRGPSSSFAIAEVHAG
jgi:hypothetical protein